MAEKADDRRYQEIVKALRALPRATPEDRKTLLREIYAPSVNWNGAHPFNALASPEDVDARYWTPLKAALPDLERRDSIIIHGASHAPDGGTWIAGCGDYMGTLENPLFDIPPTGLTATIRLGEFLRLESGMVVESYVLLDLIDLARQAGVSPLPPSRGTEGIWPGPATQDGIILKTADDGEGDATHTLVHDMLVALTSVHGTDVERIEQWRYWTPDMMWYGPSGIGATRGITGFERDHQIPFRRAFIDRWAYTHDVEDSGDHFAEVAVGNYAASGGWPSMRCTHAGDGLFGLARTDKRINMRINDFWRRDGNLLAENWVLIDVIHLLLQLEYDVFDRIRFQAGKR